MNKTFKPAVVLCLICAVAALVLAFVNKITAPAIAAYEENVVLQAYKDVAGNYELGLKKDYSDEYVECSFELKDGNKTVGYVLNLKSKGYGGEMVLVAGYDLNGIVINAKMLSNSETPGLGKKSENPDYMKIFCAKDPVPANKNMLSDSEADMVSGATMTFTGVSKAINYGSNFVKQLDGGTK